MSDVIKAIEKLKRKIRSKPITTQQVVDDNINVNFINFPDNPCEGYVHIIQFNGDNNRWLLTYTYTNGEWVLIGNVSSLVPDVSVTIPQPVNGTTSIGQVHQGYFQISQSNGAWGNITVTIEKPTTSFELSILPNTILSGATAVNNAFWNITETATHYTLVSTYPAPDITSTRVGFTITGLSSGSYSFIVVVSPGSGNELNISNNQSTKVFNIT